MREIFSSQAFGIMLAMCFYIFGAFIYRKTKLPLFNPLVVATILLILYVQISRIDLDSFLTDLSGINVFLGPLIVSLAIPIAKQKDIIKKNIVPILVGTFLGSLISIVSVLLLGPLFGLDSEMINSLIPKTTTAPIAIEISNRLGGYRAITVAVVVIGAVLGAVVIPVIIKLMNIKDPRIIGIGLGTTSHAIGTAKAIEIDSLAGAIASISFVTTGVMTVFISLFL